MQTGQAFSATITLDSLSVVRGNRLVLQQFSLFATSGNILWVRGANGSGKSTLLRAIAGLLPPLTGQITVEGKIALADENPGLDGNRPLEQALAFWAKMDGCNGNQRHDALAAMDLQALSDVPMRYLSTGQRRRAMLARVIASNAPIWLLDEPYNGLDSANCARLDTALLRHAATGGIAMVAAHQPPSINVHETVLLDSTLDRARSMGKAA
jgi:heme exporter protein A